MLIKEELEVPTDILKNLRIPSSSPRGVPVAQGLCRGGSGYLAGNLCSITASKTLLGRCTNTPL